MSDKPIDLGKLQDAVKQAKLLYSKAISIAHIAQGAMMRAQDAADRAAKKAQEAKTLLDNAKSAMLEGARTLANNS